MKFCRNISISKRAIFTALKLIFKNQIVEGENVQKFETEFSKYIGRKYGIATSSARFGLYLLFKSLDINKGKDEIILPAFMPWIVAKVALMCGLKPVFVDADVKTRNIDPQQIENKITKNTRIVLIVHLYGLPCNMGQILKITKKHQLLLIENCAQAMGAKYHGRPVGSFGDVSIFSFGKLKTCTTYGGGMILTDNKELHDRLRRELISVPPPPKFELVRRSIIIPLVWIIKTSFCISFFVHPLYSLIRFFKRDFISGQHFVGSESRICSYDETRLLQEHNMQYSHLQATLGLMQLKTLDSRIKSRQRNAAILNALLPNPPYIPNDVYSSYFFYCIETDHKERLLDALFDAGILAQAGNFPVVPDLRAFQDFKCDCPNARALSTKLVFVPIQSDLQEKDMMKIVNVFKNL
jgi:dTDP-4-amino-4,6-dideoxygalactose transaminase